VSNHGGQQIDHGEGTMAVLAEVVEATAGCAKIVIDGGFMRGTDIVKAMAMGAECVAIGWLVAIALAAGGEDMNKSDCHFRERKLLNLIGNLLQSG
jgi:isopentenyl diphosphate isomerase/L-lactate dehydrogenase-like FMN-dependent dehydrogenase